MSDNHEENGMDEEEISEVVEEQESETVDSVDSVDSVDDADSADLVDEVDEVDEAVDAGENFDESIEENAAEGNREHRVARSVSNKPLISDEQAREHAESVAPAIQIKPVARRETPRARRMNLSLTRLNPWSVAKVTFMMAVAGAIIQIVAAALVWVLLNVVGVFDQITQIVASTGLDAGGLNLADVFSLPTVLSGTTIFSIIEVVLFTVLATIIALIYNVVSSLVGGVHVTLGDD